MNTTINHLTGRENMPTTNVSSANEIAMSTTYSKIQDVIRKSNKGRSTIHGDSYHLRVALLIILRAYRMHQLDPDFFFMIALEVSQAGKFDDILYHYSSSRLLPATGSLFIQAKHKQKPARAGEASEQNGTREQSKQSGGYTIKEQALCAVVNSNATYSIPMYFMSFLEIDENLPNDARYVLCTNAPLYNELECHFSKVNPQQEESFQFCADIGATCYQIVCEVSEKPHQPGQPTDERKLPNNPFIRLIDPLKDACLAKLGKAFAEAVVEEQVIDLNNALVHTFAGLIIECIEPLKQETSNPSVSTFRFKQDFSNAKQKSTAMFYKAFKVEYNNLCRKDKQLKTNNILPHQAEIKFDRDQFTSVSNNKAVGEEAISERFAKKVLEFYGKFLLVCNSLSEEDLRTQALALLSQCCSVEPGLAFEKFQGMLLDAMKSKSPFQFDLPFVTECFAKLEHEQIIHNLITSSEDCVKSLLAKQGHIEVRLERFENTTLYAFLADMSKYEAFEFNTSLGLIVSSRILIQMLAPLKYKTVFVDSTKYSDAQDVKRRLRELLEYLKELNHATIKLITILGKHDQGFKGEMNKLAKHYRLKIVVLEQSTGSGAHADGNFMRFYVEDLTPRSLDELFQQPEYVMFGTVTSLRRMVHEKDDLHFLFTVLELCKDRSSLVRGHNSNANNYKKIKRWYIHRQIVPYEQKIEWKKTDYILSSHASEIDRALASNIQEPDPPNFQTGENKNKVCVFLNDAGHGKTTYLTWLASRLTSSEPELYVIKFIALEFSTDFERLQNGPNPHKLNNTAILRLLYRYVHLALFVPSVNKRTVKETDVQRKEADRCATRLTVTDKGPIALDTQAMAGTELSPEELIELRLFEVKFNEQKMVLILDGFDEIAPHYKEVVLSCFACFVQLYGVRSLYLSTRPYGFATDLKQTFNECHLYKLAPLSKYNIILSFHNFLLRNLEGYKYYDDHLSILRKLYASLYYLMSDIVTVPLLLYMVQIVLLPDIRERVSEQSHTITVNIFQHAKLALFQLVERFVDKKLEISNIEKTGTTDSASKTPAARTNAAVLNRKAKKDHTLMAMYVMFDDSARKKLLSGKERQRADDRMQKVIAGDQKVGLILQVQDGVPQFLHRIFAEYFTAVWLFKNRSRFREEEIFQSSTIWSSSFAKTRYFLDLMLVRERSGCDIHWALINRFNIEVVKIVRVNPDAVGNKDAGGRIPLHLGPYVDNETVLQATSLELIDTPDALLGWSALDYAFVLDDDQWCSHEEDTIDREEILDEHDETLHMTVNIPFVKHCCLKWLECGDQWKRFNDDDEFDLECFLAYVINVGSLPMTSHAKSLPAFQYLLDKTLDLHSVDVDGRNLLHIVLEEGCVYLLPCLIARGFGLMQINKLTNVCKKLLFLRAQYRTANTFSYLHQTLCLSSFAPFEATGESIFDIAIAHHRYQVALALRCYPNTKKIVC
ncbi:uncharacterized protein LOC126560827 [Anopheles maculipalpis]|uniref:uncharacterized protein LOC126560827 n=1 Tax=Anopheles maculipalpis TaxID=1496333 RepID=UPI002159A2E6|nr:uncharacterized protein LOC126560827 [Anopheles maculipalpis]